MLHPMRPQLVSGVGLRLIQGLGLLLDHLDGPAHLDLVEEDAELAEAAYQDLLTHVSRLGQVLGSLRIPGPVPENSHGLRRLRSKAARSIFERLSPTQESAPVRFVDVVERIPGTLMGLPGRLLLRQHGLVGSAPAHRIPIPEMAWAPQSDQAVARLRACGFALETGSLRERAELAQAATWALLDLRRLLGRIARKHPAPLPPFLADAEALGRAAWRISTDSRTKVLLGETPAPVDWAGRDPLAQHPLGPALWDLAPQGSSANLQAACEAAGLDALAQDPQLRARIWLMAGPAIGRLQAILADPALGPSVLPWRLSAPESLGPEKALPPLEQRLVRQLFGLSLTGIPRLALPAEHPVWDLEAADPWLAPGQWARMG